MGSHNWLEKLKHICVLRKTREGRFLINQYMIRFQMEYLEMKLGL